MSQDLPHKNSDALAPKRSLWALVIPYLLAIWCCLGILQRSPTDIPPLELLLPTVLKILVLIGVVHFALAMFIRRTPARELILLTLVSSIGLFGSARTLCVYAYGLTTEPSFLCLWLVAHALIICVCFRLELTKPLENIVLAIGVSAASMVAYQTIHISLPVNQDLAKLESLIQLLNDESPLRPESQLQLASKQAASEDSKPRKSLELHKAQGSTPFRRIGSTRMIANGVNADRMRIDLRNAEAANLPDIYYIVVDAYARQDILEQVYGFDNQPFLASLRERGFYIGDQSRSNYNMTEFSLASSLNMRHLDGLGLQEFKTRLPMRELIRQNLVVNELKQVGYSTIAFETGKSETECTNFDQYIPFGKALSDYQDVLYHGTPLPELFEMTGTLRSAARRHGDRVLFMFDELPSVAQQQANPAFVFCHMLAPHPPFLFGSDGRETDIRGHYLLADWVGFTSRFNFDLSVYRDGYRDQVAFMNEKLLEMVDTIQRSDRSSNIIIQGDHGPRMGFGHRRDQWENCEWRYRESFSILNAICMSDDIRPTAISKFYPDMTPVNTFRIIFNSLFGTKLPLKSDTSYHESKYSFVDLTNEALPLPASPNAADNNLAFVSVRDDNVDQSTDVSHTNEKQAD